MSGVSVILRPPGSTAAPTGATATPPTIQINGKTFRITSLRIRNHGMDKWRNIDLNDCKELQQVADRCKDLFNNIQPTTADLKKLSFTFELNETGILMFKKSHLDLKNISYVDTSSTKSQTHEFDIDVYDKPAQTLFHLTLIPLHAAAINLFANPKYRTDLPKTLPAPTSPPSAPAASPVLPDDVEEV